MTTAFDLLVVGGGINGAGIARDAAGRGLSVCLVEQHDLAAHTSSASTGLVHGGLRYLEQRQFRLVRESLGEREKLMAIAPHLVRPMRFVLPHAPGMRPRWMLRAGLFLYDRLQPRGRLPASTAVRLAPGAPLRAGYRDAFEYSDCTVHDSRLVIANLLDAAGLGAVIHARTRLEAARADGGRWIARCRRRDGTALEISGRALVNASGAWVNDCVIAAGLPARRRVRLVRGSHLVFPRLHGDPRAFLLQNVDRRVVFMIPWEDGYTLVGTTDVVHDGDPAEARISPEEARYLCDCVGRFLARPVAPDEAVHAFAGLRSLPDANRRASAQRLSRDYRLELQFAGGAPMLTVYGGKITTYRRLAEHAMARLAGPLAGGSGGLPGDWTATRPLPGGDIPEGDVVAFEAGALRRWPGLDPALVTRLARAHGTRISLVLGDARGPPDLGEHLGCGLHAREVDYLVRHEWARTAEDVLWRRTRLGLRGGPALAAAVARYFSTNARSIT